MTTGIASRLTTFALLALGTFGTTYALAEQLPGHQHLNGGQHNHGGDGHTHAAPPSLPAGFDPSMMDGYRLVTTGVTSTAGAGPVEGPVEGPDNMRTIGLVVRAPDGERVTSFVRHHGADVHVVVVRPDLSEFHHVHPPIVDGLIEVPLPGDGAWRVVIDAQPEGASRQLALAVEADNEQPWESTPLPPADDDVQVDVTVGAADDSDDSDDSDDTDDTDGLTVRREGLTFTLTGDAATLDRLEPYLDGPAHLIAIRDADLYYLHLHPMDMGADDAGTRTFMFDGGLGSGTWRVWLQFGYDGDVVTVPFTVSDVP